MARKTVMDGWGIMCIGEIWKLDLGKVFNTPHKNTEGCIYRRMYGPRLYDYIYW